MQACYLKSLEKTDLTEASPELVFVVTSDDRRQTRDVGMMQVWVVPKPVWNIHWGGEQRPQHTCLALLTFVFYQNNRIKSSSIFNGRSGLSYLQWSVLGCRKIRKGAWFVVSESSHLGIFNAVAVAQRLPSWCSCARQTCAAFWIPS